jgi:hypothetical protein
MDFHTFCKGSPLGFSPQTDLSVGVLAVLVEGPWVRGRSVRALWRLTFVRRLREQ